MECDKKIEEMIASGELGTMTECAYGSTIADMEHENNLKKKKEEEKTDNK